MAFLTSIAAREGHIPFRNHKTWYRIVGGDENPAKPPLLVVHGGPGLPHDYLEPLEALAETGRQVVFYDQLGCGHSDRPRDPALWSLSLFKEELSAVRIGLGLDRVYLFGHGWGGMLALEHAAAQSPGVISLVLAGTPVSMREKIEEADRLRFQLPSKVQEILVSHESAGSEDDPVYNAALMEFYRRFYCRLETWPEPLERAFTKLVAHPEVYRALIGPSEIHITGSLKDWDSTPRLGEIKAPTLITSGRWDETTRAMEGHLQQGIPGSRWVVFEDSAHMAHLEEPERYLQVLEDFLEQVERNLEKKQSERQGFRDADQK